MPEPPLTVVRRRLLIAAGIVLTAASLRGALVAVGPLIGDIRAALDLTAAEAGLLTTVPLLAFASLSFLSAPIARRAGAERTLAVSVALIVTGVLLRSAGSTAAAFGGTALFGAGIAACNVLLPAVVKREFPTRSGTMTSTYLTVMLATAGVAAATAVPLADAGLGWQGALAVTGGAPAVLALIAWLPQLDRGARPAPVQAAHVPARLWRSALAWQVTVFMGLQSMVFFCLVAWLPDLLQEQGLAASSAGVVLGVVQAASLVSSMTVPVLAARAEDQRVLVTLSTAICLAAVGGLLVDDGSFALLWAALIGLGTGSYLSLALTFFVVRTRSGREAAALSGMAQSIGYGLAAAGPPLLGLGRDAAGSWTLPLVAVLAVTAAAGAAGLGAGRSRTVGAD